MAVGNWFAQRKAWQLLILIGIPLMSSMPILMILGAVLHGLWALGVVGRVGALSSNGRLVRRVGLSLVLVMLVVVGVWGLTEFHNAELLSIKWLSLFKEEFLIWSTAFLVCFAINSAIAADCVGRIRMKEHYRATDWVLHFLLVGRFFIAGIWLVQPDVRGANGSR